MDKQKQINDFVKGLPILEYTFQDNRIYLIDSIPTVITFARGNMAKGFTLDKEGNTYPCFVVKNNGFYAHGKDAHSAFHDALQKAQSKIPLTVRIQTIQEKYPSLESEIPNNELFKLHNYLTDSCLFGRLKFCKENAITKSGKMSLKKFLLLSKDSFGAEAIRKLAEAYKFHI